MDLYNACKRAPPRVTDISIGQDVAEMLEHIKSLSSVVNQTPFSLSLAVTKLFRIINCDVRVIKLRRILSGERMKKVNGYRP